MKELSFKQKMHNYRQRKEQKHAIKRRDKIKSEENK